MLKIIFSMENEPKQDDAADALAIALCHAYLSISKNLQFK